MIEPLVLIPPMLCDARVFYAQFATLSSQVPFTFAPITAGDRIEEMASAILSWLPQKFALAGMGMGGMVAMEVLRRAPERVTRVAFISTGAQADTPEISAQREPLIIAARSGRFDDAIRAEMNPAWLAPGPYRKTSCPLSPIWPRRWALTSTYDKPARCNAAKINKTSCVRSSSQRW